MKEAYETNWRFNVEEIIDELEHNMTEKIDCYYAVELSTGVGALQIAMKLAGAKPRMKVIAE